MSKETLGSKWDQRMAGGMTAFLSKLNSFQPHNADCILMKAEAESR